MANGRLHENRQWLILQPKEVQALRQLVKDCAQNAAQADQTLFPHRPRVVPAATTSAQVFKHEAEAQQWLESEYARLISALHVAVEMGWDHYAWQLTWALSALERRRGHFQSVLDIWKSALPAVESLSSDYMHAMAHREIGSAHCRLQQHAAAMKHLELALDFAHTSSDYSFRAHIHRAFAQVWGAQKKYEEALSHSIQALELAHMAGDTLAEARALNNAGWFSAYLQHYYQAREYCENALALATELEHTELRGFTLDSLGYIAYKTGQLEQSVDNYQQALDILQSLNYTYHEANVLDHLGRVYILLGKKSGARKVWRRAIALYRQQGLKHDAQRVRTALEAL